jgi:hypothetical protein
LDSDIDDILSSIVNLGKGERSDYEWVGTLKAENVDLPPGEIVLFAVT